MNQDKATMKGIHWNGDWQDCRNTVDKGDFDAELAQAIGKEILDDYKQQEDKQFMMGWSLRSKTYFCQLWTQDDRIKHLSDKEAKILFIAASDVLQQTLFPTENRNRADLRDRMSQLCEMCIEMNDVAERNVDYDPDKYENRWEKVSELEGVYQTLFSETVQIYGN